MSEGPLPISVRSERRIPFHRINVRIGEQTKQGYLLRSIGKHKECSRDTLIFSNALEILPLLPEDVQSEWEVFSSQIASYQRSWHFHRIPTLKRVVLRSRAGKIFSGQPILTVAHHFGVVPALRIGTVNGWHVALFNEKLSSEFDEELSKDEEQIEFLHTLDEFLPQLLHSYYEQIAYYLRAIFLRPTLGKLLRSHIGYARFLANQSAASWRRLRIVQRGS